MIDFRKIAILSSLFWIVLWTSSAQNTQITELNRQRQKLINSKDSIDNLIENEKLLDVQSRLRKLGIPELQEGDSVIFHAAYCLTFSKKYRLAKWVAHILTPDIIDGRVSRTNNFRADPQVPFSGNDSDYFSKTTAADGKAKYTGFGYDRGHLAPSADFRWSANALSESYYFSNITPQSPDLNRGKWADIESFLRGYIYYNPKSYLYIITAPVLRDSLPKITQGPHQLPIPEYHYKIAVDYDKKIGIAFLCPQKNLIYPIDSYAVSIDSIEQLTGINFFPTLSQAEQNEIETSFDFKKWVPEKEKMNSTPLLSNEMPNGAYNTIEASQFIDYPKEVKICGTIVSTHKSAKGNIFINLDKSFPNQVFSATIWAKDVFNFDYQPELFLMDKRVCILGKIKDYKGIPSVYIPNQNKVQIID